jgi:hypothetical protein
MTPSNAHTTAEMSEATTHTGLIHAGTGAGLAVVQLSAIIPGLLPTLALLAVFTAVLVLPMLALALVAAVLGAPPLVLWRLVTRRRRRRSLRATQTVVEV